jgi:hypothetical protein
MTRFRWTALLAIAGLLVGGGLTLAQDHASVSNAIANVEPSRLAEIAANRDRTISELMGMWAPHEGASQLETALQAATNKQLLLISNAANFAEVEKVLLGEDAGKAFPNTLGDTTQDYVFTPVTPCRIFDTRNAGGAFAANTSREFYVYGVAGDIAPQGGNASGCPAPAGKGEPRAAHLQVTVIPVGSPGNVRVYAANLATPNTSVVSFISGLNFSNALTVGTYYAIGPKEIEVYVGNASAHVTADVMGYYYDVPSVPGAVEDTGFAVSSGNTPTATLQFLAPPTVVTVTSPTQIVNVVSNKAFGSSLAGGGTALTLYMCYRVSGSAVTPTPIGGAGAFSGNQALPQGTRVVMGLSANVSGLSAADYEVGLCGTGTNWNSNEWGFTTALVFNAPN